MELTLFFFLAFVKLSRFFSWLRKNEIVNCKIVLILDLKIAQIKMQSLQEMQFLCFRYENFYNTFQQNISCTIVTIHNVTLIFEFKKEQKVFKNWITMDHFHLRNVKQYNLLYKKNKKYNIQRYKVWIWATQKNSNGF